MVFDLSMCDRIDTDNYDEKYDSVGETRVTDDMIKILFIMKSVFPSISYGISYIEGR